MNQTVCEYTSRIKTQSQILCNKFRDFLVKNASVLLVVHVFIVQSDEPLEFRFFTLFHNHRFIHFIVYTIRTTFFDQSQRNRFKWTGFANKVFPFID